VTGAEVGFFLHFFSSSSSPPLLLSMSSYFAAAAAAVWGSTATETTNTHINPKHATQEEVDRRVDALSAALASTDAAALLRKGGEPGLLPTASADEIDRATLSRWLKAEKLDVASAAERLEKHARWRADYVSRRSEAEARPRRERERDRENKRCGRAVILASKRRRQTPRRRFSTPILTLFSPLFQSLPNPGADGTHRAGEWGCVSGRRATLEDGRAARRAGRGRFEFLDGTGGIRCFFFLSSFLFFFLVDGTAAAAASSSLSFFLQPDLLSKKTPLSPLSLSHASTHHSPRSPRSSPTIRSSSNREQTPPAGPSSSSLSGSTTRTATRPRSRGSSGSSAGCSTCPSPRPRASAPPRTEAARISLRWGTGS